MVTSRAATVQDYVDELPEGRREAIARVRDVVRGHLPDGYRETMAWGMITWCIPLERYPDTYNGQPLGYVALASQKNFMTLYLMGAYADPAQRERLEQAYANAGKRLDMGKSCLHFRRVEDLPLDLIGELIASKTPDDLIALMEESRAAARRAKPAAKKPAAKKSAAKRAR